MDSNNDNNSNNNINENEKKTLNNDDDDGEVEQQGTERIPPRSSTSNDNLSSDDREENSRVPLMTPNSTSASTRKKIRSTPTPSFRKTIQSSDDRIPSREPPSSASSTPRATTSKKPPPPSPISSPKPSSSLTPKPPPLSSPKPSSSITPKPPSSNKAKKIYKQDSDTTLHTSGSNVSNRSPKPPPLPRKKISPLPSSSSLRSTTDGTKGAPSSSSTNSTSNDDGNKPLSSAQSRFLIDDDMEQPTTTLRSMSGTSMRSSSGANSVGSSSGGRNAMVERAMQQQQQQEEQYEDAENSAINVAAEEREYYEYETSLNASNNNKKSKRQQRTGSMGLGSFRPDEQMPTYRRPRGSMDMSGSSGRNKSRTPPRMRQRGSMDNSPQRMRPRGSMDMMGNNSGSGGRTPPRMRPRGSMDMMRPMNNNSGGGNRNNGRTPPRSRPRSGSTDGVRAPQRRNRSRSPSREAMNDTTNISPNRSRNQFRARSMDMRPRLSMDMMRPTTTNVRMKRASMDLSPTRQKRASMDMSGQNHPQSYGHRTRSMDVRGSGGGNRYARNRSIDMVNPGIHLAGNRIVNENDSTFRLDAKEGITLNLRKRHNATGSSSNNNNNSMSSSNNHRMRGHGVSNLYTMQSVIQARGRRRTTILEESETLGSSEHDDSLEDENNQNNNKKKEKLETFKDEASSVPTETDEASGTDSTASMEESEQKSALVDSTNKKKTNSASFRNMMSSFKQPSTGDISLQDGTTRDVPFPHVKAAVRRLSNSSMMSELSLGDLDVVNQKENLRKSTNVTRMSLITPEAMAESTPNHPHPGLEYPPLYFCIKHSPFLMGVVKSFIRFRWRSSYPLQKRVPLSRLLRKVNLFCTYGELFLIIPFFVTLVCCIIYSFVYPSVSISGHTARTPLIFAFATAMHNSLLTLLLGLPFERAVFYHKLAARLAFVCGIQHTIVSYFWPDYGNPENTIQPGDIEPQMERDLTYGADPTHSTYYSFIGSEPNFGRFMFADSINVGGTGIISFMTLMIITALPYVRRKVFELFYFVHLFCCVAMLACAFYHTGFLVPLLGSLTWGLDFLIRKVYMALFRYPRKASIRIISESVVEICFPKTTSFHYNPGQYVFMAIPEISYFEWHPFSISSSPEQKIVTFHIRKAGSWTHALYDLADVQNEISILLEGPYGAVGVDVTSDRYKMVMLFSGGIGVTPMQALCNQIMYEHSSGLRTMKKLSFIWIERDPIVLQKVDVVRRETINKSTFSMSRHGSISFPSESEFEDETEMDEELQLLDLENSSKPGVGIVKFADDNNTPPAYSGGHRSILSDHHHHDDSYRDTNTNRNESNDAPPQFMEPQGLASTLLSLVPASAVPDEVLETHYDLEELGDDDDESDIEEEQTFFQSLMPTMSLTPGSVFDRSNNNNHNNDEDDYVDEFYDEDNYVMADEFDNNTMCQSFLDDAYGDMDMNENFDDDESPENALDLQVYLTARKEVDPATENLPFVHRGRPDIKDIFRKMRDEAMARGECRVAVCVCAPKIIVNMCHKASVKYSDRHVCFDFHYEVFD